MKCAWPTITLESAGFEISTVVSCIVLAPCGYCGDDNPEVVAPEVSIRQWRGGGYRPDTSHQFRDAAAVVFLPALLARTAHLDEERHRRALRLCPQRRRPQLARRSDARARDRQPCGMHHLRARVGRGDMSRPGDSARQSRGSRRAPSQSARRAAWAVLSIRSADPTAAVHRALDAHGAAPRRRQAEDVRANADA